MERILKRVNHSHVCSCQKKSEFVGRKITQPKMRSGKKEKKILSIFFLLLSLNYSSTLESATIRRKCSREHCDWSWWCVRRHRGRTMNKCLMRANELSSTSHRYNNFHQWVHYKAIKREKRGLKTWVFKKVFKKAYKHKINSKKVIRKKLFENILKTFQKTPNCSKKFKFLSFSYNP